MPPATPCPETVRLRDATGEALSREVERLTSVDHFAALVMSS